MGEGSFLVVVSILLVLIIFTICVIIKLCKKKKIINDIDNFDKVLADGLIKSANKFSDITIEDNTIFTREDLLNCAYNKSNN